MLFTHVILKVQISHFKSNLFIFNCSEFSMACIPQKRGALYLIFRFDYGDSALCDTEIECMVRNRGAVHGVMQYRMYQQPYVCNETVRLKL